MDPVMHVLAQSGQGGGMLPTLFWFGLFAIVLASMWKVFAKAGEPGWAAVVPIVNLFYLCKIAGRPSWWLLLMLVPLVNFFVLGILSFDIAKAFGKSPTFGLGLWFLGFVFYPVLAFGSSQYNAPRSNGLSHFGHDEKSIAA